ncbi:MAG: riboflavin biosynthesis protein RibD, partial [Nitrospinae bacterium RIFCSPLOWO2_12_FULL_47_7]
MRRALDLARKAKGRTSPNPMVGAVVVKNGKIVGEGYHKKAGLPHAEVGALNKAGKLARGAQLFVNLEPCCHLGRTPPCTEAIIKSGIKNVFVGMGDPNKLVGGKGIRALKKAGIKVEIGILKADCQRLNEVFVKHVRTGLPFVMLKSALSLDGKTATATGVSQWITGPQARKLVHEIRDEVDAVMV